jgi:hypothetical protein
MTKSIHKFIISFSFSYLLYIIINKFVFEISFITFICLEILLIFKQVLSIFVSKNST